MPPYEDATEDDDMSTTQLTPAPREALARTLRALASRSQNAGAIAESITWIGRAREDSAVPIAVLLGARHSNATRVTWSTVPTTHQTPTPAPAAVWILTDADTGSLLAERGAAKAYCSTTSIERILTGRTGPATRIGNDKRRWALPDRLAGDEKIASMETRAAQLADALACCQHAVADENDIRHYLCGVAIGGTEGTANAQMIATDGHQLALHSLALTGTVEGFWGTSAHQNTEVVLPRRTLRGLAKLLTVTCSTNPFAKAHVTRLGTRVLIRLGRQSAIEIATIDGHFPNWRRVIPIASPELTTKEVKTSDFAAALQASTAQAARRDCPSDGDQPSAWPIAHLRLDDEQIAIQCRPKYMPHDGGEPYATTTVAARTVRTTDNEPMEFYLNHNYLANALGACARSGTRTQIEVSDSRHPIVLRSAGSTIMLMPIRPW